MRLPATTCCKAYKRKRINTFQPMVVNDDLQLKEREEEKFEKQDERVGGKTAMQSHYYFYKNQDKYSKGLRRINKGKSLVQ